MLTLFLLTTAPVIQIAVSYLRIKQRINLPIGAVMLLSFMLGVIFSFVAMNTASVPTPPPGSIRCGTFVVAILFGGIFLQMITAPLIGIISYSVYWLNKKKY